MGPEVLAASQIASTSAMASTGFDIAGKIFKGFGEKSAQDFQAAKDQRAAEIAKLRADQTDTQLREQLHTTLGNIDAIRAASNIDALSPTTAAIKANETRVADRQRQIAVGNLQAQAREDQLSAKYHQELGNWALVGSFLDAGSSAGKGIYNAYK